MGARVIAANRRSSSRLGWPRTVATAIAFLFIALALWAAWANYQRPTGGDFISFWSAGKLALQGHASAAYDIAVHRAIEKSILPRVGLIPFPYPPPFLMMVTPFALVPFRVAFILWVFATALLYALAARRITPLAFAMANPPMLIDYMSGQTGLLVAAIFIGGLSLLPTAPFVAGAILGLLIIKPQLGLLLPFAMIAGREWRVIAGAVASSATLLILAALLYGTDSYRSFLEVIPNYVQFMRQNRWDWREFASVFAFARYFSVDQSFALALQLALAASAATVTSIAWAQGWEEKVPILAAGSLLMSGYLLTYDALLLLVPAAYFVKQRRWVVLGLLWALTLLPVMHLFGLYQGPNTIPVAAILSMAILSARRLQGRETADAARSPEDCPEERERISGLGEIATPPGTR